MKEEAGAGTVLEGTLQRIVFHNPTTQWTVARLEVGGGGPLVTVVGSLLGVSVGTPVVLRGAWQDDRRFGRQFRVASYHTKSPETLLGIERYLGSGMIPGVGPELAKRLVEHFQLDTLEVIGREPGRLIEVDGIGPARARSIAEAWAAQRDIQDVMVFLRGHGVSAAYALRIVRRYGKDAIAVVRRNPYRLAIDIWGIGFKIADGIARSLGMEATAPERLEAGVLHVMGELVEDGHVHAPEDAILGRAAELLAVPSELLEQATLRLLGDGMVVREALTEGKSCLSLLAMWQSESEAAAAFARLCATPAEPWTGDVPAALASFEQRAGLRLADQQRRAAMAAARDKCVVVTGGPGVGKTTIVRAIVGLMGAKMRRVALAAPTGRAAKRLGEATGGPAMTLHRLLEFQPQTQSFARGPHAPLAVDAVVVDEMSMVDTELFRALVAAMPASAQLVLVGDVDQLPSVGAGAVLSDVIASGAATVVELTEIFRQAAESRIVINAHRVNRGEMPELERPPGGDPARSDFYFVERDEPEAARETLLELVTQRIPARFGLDPLREVQVLTPMHRGELGTVALNHALQARLNPPSPGAPELVRGERVLRAGDKVMQVRNDYDRDVFNGDVGLVREIRAAEPDEGEAAAGRSLLVELADGRVVEYAAADLDQLAHAFAISVHKSQGSEYPAVVIPLLTQHYLMLQRNLLYTAITRGKRLVVLVGSRRAVHMAVRNQAGGTRWTWLAERIRQSLGRPVEGQK
ncbi:MAG TPA: ATP-dependent RecD-like DNA helicase [Candidatus Acidoferrum sp.]|nr:ATP-dependent RecD-like DNA helicase [Candidatus Acidoferrum sp.]